MTEKPKTALDYYNGKSELPENAFRVSASSFSTFMDRPHEWYRQHILGEEGFTGNTASVIGTIVHYVAECYGKKEPVSKPDIEQYILNHVDHPDVDTIEVRESYKEMAEALVNQYISKNMPTEVEEFVTYEMYPNYFVGGSIDQCTQDIIVDYKTYNSKTKPKCIPLHYKYQLLIYAYVLRALGREKQRIRLVYINRAIDGRYTSEKTGKACGKIHPPEVTVLTEQIQPEDYEFIESVLRLNIESVMKAKEDPSLAYLIFRDYRLRLNDPLI